MYAVLKFTLKPYSLNTVLHVDVYLYEKNTSFMNIFKPNPFIFFFQKRNYLGFKLLELDKVLKKEKGNQSRIRLVLLGVS